MPEQLMERIREAYEGLIPPTETEASLRAALSRTPQEKPRLRIARPAILVGVAAAVLVTAYLFLRPSPPLPPPAVADADAERAANLAAYERMKTDLHAKHQGEWVVIAGGALRAVSTSFEEVLWEAAASGGPDAAHRYVFQVGEEGDVDGRPWANFWYGPRFAGPPLIVALDVEVVFSSRERILYKGDDIENGVVSRKGPPFIRSPLTIGPPGGASRVQDVQIGSVGPPMFVGHDDVLDLGLARFEVPGTATMMGEPHRRVLLEVAIPELGAKATVIGVTPAFPREKLVNFLRWRNAFWNWGENLVTEYVLKDREGKWVLFGADRVLGEGASPEEALLAGDQEADTRYHRYLMRLPRAEPLRIDRNFNARTVVTLNGQTVSARIAGLGGPYLVDPETANRLALELAEEGREVFINAAPGDPPNRAGYAWLGETGKLALVVVARIDK